MQQPLPANQEQKSLGLDRSKPLDSTATDQVEPIEASQKPSSLPSLLDSDYQPLPVVLDGSVENFDPRARAAELAKAMPRKWCGTFQSFVDDSQFDVTVQFGTVKSIGQMVNLQGEMILGNVRTAVNGNLNAKSDQFELVPLSNQLISSVEPGGLFMGFQGVTLTGWKSPDLNNPGGRLELSKECGVQSSETLPIRSLW